MYMGVILKLAQGYQVHVGAPHVYGGDPGKLRFYQDPA